MNTYKDWKAKLASAYSSMLKYSKITVCPSDRQHKLGLESFLNTSQWPISLILSNIYDALLVFKSIKSLTPNPRLTCILVPEKKLVTQNSHQWDCTNDSTNAEFHH